MGLNILKGVFMGVVKGGFSIRFLRLFLSIFFIFLGIAGVSRQIGEGSFFQLSAGHTNLEIIFGVVEIVCGILLLLGMFMFVDRKITSLAGLVVLIFWIIRIVLTRFVWGLNLNSSISNLFLWLLFLSCELLIAAAIWSVMQRYE